MAPESTFDSARVQCPYCSHGHSVAPGNLGIRIRCVKCGRSFQTGRSQRGNRVVDDLTNFVGGLTQGQSEHEVQDDMAGEGFPVDDATHAGGEVKGPKALFAELESKMAEPEIPASTLLRWALGAAVFSALGVCIFNAPCETIVSGIMGLVPIPPMPITMLIGGFMVFFGSLLTGCFAYDYLEQFLGIRTRENRQFAVGVSIVLAFAVALLFMWGQIREWLSMLAENW